MRTDAMKSLDIDIAREAFNTKQACQIIETTGRKIRYWDQKGLVKPSFRPACGRGSTRLYSYADLLALQTVRKFREKGLSLQRIRRCILYLRKRLPDITRPLNFCTLLTDGETIYLALDEQTLIDTVRKQGQHVFLQLSIAALDRELRGRVVAFVRKRIEEVTVGDYTYQVEIEPDVEDGGFVAQVAGLPGCITDGDTLEEVLEMVEDAIGCWLEAHEDMKRRGINVPKVVSRRRKATA